MRTEKHTVADKNKDIIYTSYLIHTDKQLINSYIKYRSISPDIWR